MHQLSSNRFIFSVTTGRSGSNFITEALGCLKGVCSTHEPKPRYDRVMRMVQHYPNVARQFLLEKKLPAIQKQLKPHQTYFESSHLISKGFLEAWLEIDDLPVPDLICLNRSHREISLSFNQLNSIPGKTINGLTYLLSPFDPYTLTTVNDPSALNDYQSCYWYCLETEERKKKYTQLIESRKGQVIQLSVNDIKNLEGFNNFREKFALPDYSFSGKRKFKNLASTRVNAKLQKKSKLSYTEKQLDTWEKEVRDALIYR